MTSEFNSTFGIIYIIIGLLFSSISVVLIGNKVNKRFLKIALLSGIFLIGGIIVAIWPFDTNNGRIQGIKYTESLLGVAMIIGALLTQIIYYFLLEPKRKTKAILTEVEQICTSLKMEAVGLENLNKGTTQHPAIWYKGYRNNRYCTVQELYDFRQNVATRSRSDKTYHYHQFHFFPEVQSNLAFRIRAKGMKAFYNEPAFENATAVLFNDQLLDDTFDAFGNNYTDTGRFLQQFDIRNLLKTHQQHLRGVIDMQVTEGKFVLKVLTPSELEISMFDSNWRAKVTKLNIEQMEAVLQFATTMLDHWDKLVAHRNNG